MAGRIKNNENSQWQKVLRVLHAECASGCVTNNKLAIAGALSGEIVMSRLSVYICEIKRHTGVVIRPVRDGRNVIGYQIVNLNVAADYIANLDSLQAAGGAVAAAPKTKKKSSAASKKVLAAKPEIVEVSSAEEEEEVRKPLRWVDSVTGEEIIEEDELEA